MNILQSPALGPNSPPPVIPRSKWYYNHRLSLLFLACLQAFFSSGIFYGWASLYTLFLEAGVYSDKCNFPVGTNNINSFDQSDYICESQKLSLQLIYTISSSVNLMAQLPWGFILDWYGPKFCCASASSLVIAGFIGLSASSAGFIDLYLLSICCIAGAGPGVQISLFHLSELFPHHKSTVLAIVTGAFQLGFVVFLCFKTVYMSAAGSISLSLLSALYCIPLIILLIIGIIVWPEAPCETIDADSDHLTFTSQPHSLAALKAEGILTSKLFNNTNTVESEKQHLLNGDSSFTVSIVPVVSLGPSALSEDIEAINNNNTNTNNTIPIDSNSNLDSINPNLKGSAYTQPFLKQLFSPSFTAVLIWVCLCLFWANNYIGSVVEQLYIKSSADRDSTRAYTDWFTLCLPLGVFGIPLFGWLTDHLGFTASITATSILGIFYSIFALLPTLNIQLITFLSYAFFRTFLFSVLFSYLANEFGYRHFGLLSGIVLLLSGLICSLQYFLTANTVASDIDGSSSDLAANQLIQSDQNKFRTINYAQLITMILTIGFAIYTGITQSKRTEKLIQKQQHKYSKLPLHSHYQHSQQPFKQHQHHRRKSSDSAAAAGSGSAAESKSDLNNNKQYLSFESI